MGPTLKINFKDPERTYFPGEFVQGQLILSNRKEIKCKAITLKFEGCGFVDLKRAKKKSEDVSSMTEPYYASVQTLLGGGDSATQDLGIGDHSFEFSFCIPLNSPSSFESKNGYVRHSCEASLYRNKSQTRAVKTTSLYIVVSVLDLNAHEWTKAPVSEFSEIKVNSLFGGSGVISAKVNLSRSGFVPGDLIHISSDIVNSSHRILSEAKAELIQTTSFNVGNHTLATNQTIASRAHKLLGGHDSWRDEALKIPQTVPSHLTGCSNIGVQYFFSFQVTAKGGSRCVGLKIPLTIGSVPFEDDIPVEREPQLGIQPQPAINPDFVSETFEPFAPTTQATGPILYPNVAPPSYEESLYHEKPKH